MTDEEWMAATASRIETSEGDVLTAYPDPLSGAEPWTIGYGHTGPEVHPGLVWTQAQATETLLNVDLPKFVAAARASLSPGIFDALNDARRFVIVDLVYNMGPGANGWGGFAATQGLIAQAQRLKDAGQLVQAHALFVEAAQHLKASAWFGQVGNRAKRDVAMLVAGDWCNPNGDGSDVGA